MQKYSVFSLIKNAFSNHEKWDLAWKDPTPKKEYDVVIIGGGGHGLATAYYLAKEHQITNVAVIEKGWIGGGNIGRNTTIIRSNFMYDDMWRNMSQELNFNVMFSPRGIINLAHSDAQMNAYARRGNSMRLNGIDAVLLNREEVKKIIPMADFSEDVRYPIFGGLAQPSAGTARHDAVAWGYARQADSMGVDIIQNCEVTGFDIEAGKITGLRTSRGDIKSKKIGLCVAGSTNVLAEKLNMTLPIETHLLQACVSEPVKPVLDGVVTFGAGHFYISQSDKGEMVMGGDLDGYNSYAQKGNLPTIQHVLTGGVALFPFLSRLKMLRTWGGIMDMSMDGSPIIDKTHIDGLYLNCGWCYGGFKSVPSSGWTFAHTIAQDTQKEFAYGGDGTITRPKLNQEISDEEWDNFVYLRKSPRGKHIELWHHIAGCRQWFKVERDTTTHEIFRTFKPEE